MALRTCRECGGQVSTSAGKCPHCGALRSQLDFGRVLILFLIVVGVLYAIAQYMNSVNALNR